ncbi:MAG: hypothetical protein HYS86_01320, partial [Candidatus Chisholmbacteria bacterium]|nr:hypothetical protein [Candidatus Chisholmbacteria bacterium]
EEFRDLRFGDFITGADAGQVLIPGPGLFGGKEEPEVPEPEVRSDLRQPVAYQSIKSLLVGWEESDFVPVKASEQDRTGRLIEAERVVRKAELLALISVRPELSRTQEFDEAKKIYEQLFGIRFVDEPASERDLEKRSLVGDGAWIPTSMIVDVSPLGARRAFIRAIRRGGLGSPDVRMPPGVDDVLAVSLAVPQGSSWIGLARAHVKIVDQEEEKLGLADFALAFEGDAASLAGLDYVEYGDINFGSNAFAVASRFESRSIGRSLLSLVRRVSYHSGISNLFIVPAEGSRGYWESLGGRAVRREVPGSNGELKKVEGYDFVAGPNASQPYDMRAFGTLSTLGTESVKLAGTYDETTIDDALGLALALADHIRTGVEREISADEFWTDEAKSRLNQTRERILEELEPYGLEVLDADSSSFATFERTPDRYLGYRISNPIWTGHTNPTSGFIHLYSPFGNAQKTEFFWLALTHELLHRASVRIRAAGETFVERFGFFFTTADENLSGWLNEAVVERTAEETLRGMIGWWRYSDAFAYQTKQYRREVAALDRLIKAIHQKTGYSEKYIWGQFKKGTFGRGQALSAARLVEDTFGTGTFRDLLSIEDQPKDTVRITEAKRRYVLHLAATVRQEYGGIRGLILRWRERGVLSAFGVAEAATRLKGFTDAIESFNNPDCWIGDAGVVGKVYAHSTSFDFAQDKRSGQAGLGQVKGETNSSGCPIWAMSPLRFLREWRRNPEFRREVRGGSTGGERGSLGLLFWPVALLPAENESKVCEGGKRLPDRVLTSSYGESYRLSGWPLGTYLFSRTGGLLKLDGAVYLGGGKFFISNGLVLYQTSGDPGEWKETNLVIEEKSNGLTLEVEWNRRKLIDINTLKPVRREYMETCYDGQHLYYREP